MTEQLQPRPVSQLWFTPYAWAKLLHMCHWSNNEVGAMGLATAEDPFLIEDLWIPKQEVSPVSTRFDMDDFAVTQLALADPDSPKARHPRCFRRVWIHTHPEGVHTPSDRDEQTFEAIVGRADWGVMFILAKDGQTYCRMRALAGDVLVDQQLEVGVAWEYDFPAADHAAWTAELETNVSNRPVIQFPVLGPSTKTTTRVVATPRKFTPLAPTAGPGWRTVVANGQQLLPGVQPKRTARNLRIIAHSDSILSGVSGRQMAALLTDDVSHIGLTSATIAVLDKVGVTLVPGTAPAQFKHADLPEPVTSTGLLNIDRLQVAEMAIMNDSDWHALEDDLVAVAGDRVIGVNGHVDSYDEPLEVAYPWLTYDGTTLLLSDTELTSLIDDVTGEFVNEADTRETPVGFFPHDEPADRDVPTRGYLTLAEQDLRDQQRASETLAQALNRLSEQPVRGLNLDALERATKQVLEVTDFARAEGLTVEAIEQALTLLAAKAAAEGWLPEAVFKIKELRTNGYSLTRPAPVIDEQQAVNQLLLGDQGEY